MLKTCPKCKNRSQVYKEGFKCRSCGYEKIIERDEKGREIEDPEKKRLKRRIAELEEQIEKLLAEKKQIRISQLAPNRVSLKETKTVGEIIVSIEPIQLHDYIGKSLVITVDDKVIYNETIRD